MSTPARALERVNALPAEARLLLLTACGDWTDGLIAEAVREPLNWSAVLGFATRQHACAVAANRLALAGPPAAAAETIASLRRQGTVEEFRMAVLEERLDRLIARLSEEGVESVLLKGAAVALRYFGSLKARPMGDLDVLVRPERAEDARRVAEALGWVPRAGLRDEQYVGRAHLRPLVAGDGVGFGLEIHTALFPDDAPFRFPPEEVWSRAASLDRPGHPATPGAEDLLLHACLHFAWSHRFRHGAWRTVRDLDAIAHDPALRPAEFGRLAKDARGESCVYWTCALVGEVTGRALPVLPSEGPQRTEGALHAALLRHLGIEAAYAPDAPGTRRLGRVLWSLAIRPRASGHGSARPWKGEERWLEAGDGNQAPRNGPFRGRVAGFVEYSGRVLGFGPRAVARRTRS